MIIHFERIIRRIRRFLSRSQWVVRLFRLQRRPYKPHESALIILQIDGLSRRQLEKALQRGRMPFLRELLGREEYRLTSHYCGVPSTTPAVQGELFYGKKQAVPAFFYYDREEGIERVFFDAVSANAIARKIGRDCADPLLEGGSSYSNVFSGGASEARFCAQTLSLESWLKRADPFSILVALLLHLATLLRIIGLMIAEVILALYDLINGILGRHQLLPELKFAVSRIATSILLRELIRFMVKADIVRGVPIIYANFLGYDEQAHRRGPTSAFAHWSLKGIDGAIKDIFRSAMRAQSREYHVLILSDHGQESSVSYKRKYGISLRERATALCHELGITFDSITDKGAILEDRRNLARHYFRLARRLHRNIISGRKELNYPVRVTAMGSFGHIYFNGPVTDQQRFAFARALTARAKVPWVFLVCRKTGNIIAISASDEFTLSPDTAAAVLSEGHQFLDEAASDLASICRHSDAGDLVIWGGGRTQGEDFITFAKAESGAHGGPGVEETHGFFMYPPEIHPPAAKSHVRPLDIREAIHTWLRVAGEKSIHIDPHQRSFDKLRVATYNIHSCIGMDGKVLPQRVAAVLRRLHPDIVALQEVDSGRERSFYRDQISQIAREMKMQYLYLPLIREPEGEYGIAIMSRYPFETVRLKSYSISRQSRHSEERGFIWVRVNMPGQSIHFFNTHFGLFRREQLEQASQLAGAELLGSIAAGEKVVLCGDFNCLPDSQPYLLLTEQLQDVQRLLRGHKPKPTFFGRRPVFRLDHIFVSEGVKVNRIIIPRSSMARAASDHLPLSADLQI